MKRSASEPGLIVYSACQFAELTFVSVSINPIR